LNGSFAALLALALVSALAPPAVGAPDEVAAANVAPAAASAAQAAPGTVVKVKTADLYWNFGKVNASVYKMNKSYTLKVLGRGDIPAKGVSGIVVKFTIKSAKPGKLHIASPGTKFSYYIPYAAKPASATVLIPMGPAGTFKYKVTGADYPDSLGYVVQAYVVGPTAANGTYKSGSIVSTALQKLAFKGKAKITATLPGSAVPKKVTKVALNVSYKNGKKAAAKRVVGTVSANGTKATFAPTKTMKQVVGVALAGYYINTVAASADTVKPTLTFAAINSSKQINLATAATVTLSGTVKDAASAIKQVAVYSDGTAIGSATLDTTKATPTWTYQLTPTAGTHQITVKATDFAGNTTEAVQSYTATSLADGLAAAKVGDLVYYGQITAAADGVTGDVPRYRRDIPEGPLKWQVLAVENGKLLLITDQLVYEGWYHKKLDTVSWAGSSIRAWLNSKFLSATFTAEQQQQIATMQHANVDNLDSATTEDKVFLLSIAEAQTYFPTNASRKAKMCYYDGGWVVTECFDMHWWLRSQGSWVMYKTEKIVRAAAVSAFTGEIDTTGGNVGGNNANNYGIRPAIWVTLGG
jgi:hypothetical protein